MLPSPFNAWLRPLAVAPACVDADAAAAAGVLWISSCLASEAPVTLLPRHTTGSQPVIPCDKLLGILTWPTSQHVGLEIRGAGNPKSFHVFKTTWVDVAASDRSCWSPLPARPLMAPATLPPRHTTDHNLWFPVKSFLLPCPDPLLNQPGLEITGCWEAQILLLCLQNNVIVQG